MVIATYHELAGDFACAEIIDHPDPRCRNIGGVLPNGMRELPRGKRRRTVSRCKVTASMMSGICREHDYYRVVKP